jgi:hypothetical protein
MSSCEVNINAVEILTPLVMQRETNRKRQNTQQKGQTPKRTSEEKRGGTKGDLLDHDLLFGFGLERSEEIALDDVGDNASQSWRRNEDVDIRTLDFDDFNQGRLGFLETGAELFSDLYGLQSCVAEKKKE